VPRWERGRTDARGEVKNIPPLPAPCFPLPTLEKKKKIQLKPGSWLGRGRGCRRLPKSSRSRDFPLQIPGGERGDRGSVPASRSGASPAAGPAGDADRWAGCGDGAGGMRSLAGLPPGQTNPTAKPRIRPTAPEPINFPAEPHGQSRGIICSREPERPSPVPGTRSYPEASSQPGVGWGCWGHWDGDGMGWEWWDAGDTGMGMGWG